jgi:hypothetical protein
MRRILLLIATAAAIAYALRVAPVVGRWSGVDTCLDRGGRVEAATRTCELAKGARVPLRDQERDARFWGYVGFVSLTPGLALVWLVHRATRRKRGGETPARAI